MQGFQAELPAYVPPEGVPGADQLHCTGIAGNGCRGLKVYGRGIESANTPLIDQARSQELAIWAAGAVWPQLTGAIQAGLSQLADYEEQKHGKLIQAFAAQIEEVDSRTVVAKVQQALTDYKAEVAQELGRMQEEIGQLQRKHPERGEPLAATMPRAAALATDFDPQVPPLEIPDGVPDQEKVHVTGGALHSGGSNGRMLGVQLLGEGANQALSQTLDAERIRRLVVWAAGAVAPQLEERLQAGLKRVFEQATAHFEQRIGQVLMAVAKQIDDVDIRKAFAAQQGAFNAHVVKVEEENGLLREQVAAMSAQMKAMEARLAALEGS